jgi:hypothetical protein
MDEEPADTLRRKRAAVFGEPIALGDLFFLKRQDRTAARGSSKVEPHAEHGIAQRRRRVGLDQPLGGCLAGRLARLKRRDAAGQLIEDFRDISRRLGTLDTGSDVEEGHQRPTASTIPAKAGTHSSTPETVDR